MTLRATKHFWVFENNKIENIVNYNKYPGGLKQGNGVHSNQYISNFSSINLIA